MGTLYTPTDNLVQHLVDYGEDEAAGHVMNLTKEDFDHLAEIAFDHACTGMLLAKALALAAVEIIEGKPRELKKKRRVFAR